jgi:membrane protease YdiL (CAAX protease family)
MNILSGSVANGLATFVTMVVLSYLAIYIYRKGMIFSIALPRVKTLFRPIRFAIIVSIGVNIALAILTVVLGGEMEGHPAINNFAPWQAILLVVICALISEELLFRGFLLNFIKPMFTGGFCINKRRISTPILISAIVFSLAHLVLIFSGVGLPFILRMLAFTFVLGLIAGYYQEKHQNTAYAILVHMSANSLIILSLLSKWH